VFVRKSRPIRKVSMAFIGTKNFTPAEVACKCGCGKLPEQSFMELVQILRDVVGFPFKVTSGARCSTYNQKVSTTGPEGPHTTGRAIDIAVYGERALKLIRAALMSGITGIGVMQHGPIEKRFIHLDDLPAAHKRPNVWTY
jgi:zinc D-Ala-D-Ala carboxypeptidase